MGNYDILPGGSQVKCWQAHYIQLKEGHHVPEIDPTGEPSSYIVLLKEGGYVRVKDNVIVEIVEDSKRHYPEEFGLPCFNKWGDLVTSGRGLDAQNYFP